MAEIVTAYKAGADEAAATGNSFTYHRPFGDQPARYEALRNEGLVLARMIERYCPPSADRSAAIRKLRECIMTANAAIACNEREP